jgi:hypothetical protein
MDRFEIKQLNIAEKTFESINHGAFDLNFCELMIELTGFQAEYLFMMINPKAVIGDDLSNSIVDFFIKELKITEKDIFISSANLVYLRPFTNDDIVRIKIRYCAKNKVEINLNGVNSFVNSEFNKK